MSTSLTGSLTQSPTSSRTDEYTEDDRHQDESSSEMYASSRNSSLSLESNTQPLLHSSMTTTPFIGITDDNSVTDHLDRPELLHEVGHTLSFRVVVDIFEDGKAPRTCVVSTIATDTVETFKRAIQHSEHIPVANQRLVFANQQLKNDRHLSFDPNASASSIGDGYKIKPGDTCTLVVLTAEQVLASSSSSSSFTPPTKLKPTTRSAKAYGHASSHPYLKTTSSNNNNTSNSNRLLSTKKLIGQTNRSLHVRSKPTVLEIRRGALTPGWAVKKRARKPHDRFRPTNYQSFGQKSDESFMKSEMVNGGLHPYLFDRKKKIPTLIKQQQRPSTAHAGVSLARQLGLPESDAQWDSALEMQFKTLFFQLSPRKREDVLNDLLLHARDFSEQQTIHTRQAFGTSSRTGTRRGGGTTGPRVRPSTSHPRLSSSSSSASSNQYMGHNRSNKLDRLVLESSSNNNNGHGSSSRQNNRSRRNGRLTMTERANLKHQIYQLQDLTKTQKESLAALGQKYTTLKETSRAHIAATQVNLKQTQQELRERITNEMTGALLTPEEAKNMLAERTCFQNQIDELEQQLNALRTRVKIREMSVSSHGRDVSRTIPLDQKDNKNERTLDNDAGDNSGTELQTQKLDAAMTDTDTVVASSTATTPRVSVPSIDEPPLERPRSHPNSNRESEDVDLSRLLQRANSHPELVSSSRGQAINDDRTNNNGSDGGNRSSGGSDGSGGSGGEHSGRSHRREDSPRESQPQNIEEKMMSLRTSIRNRMNEAIPSIDQAALRFKKIDPYGEDFLNWAHSLASNGSRVEETMSRKSRRLLKAVTTLARCDGLSSRSAQHLVDTGHEDKSFQKLQKMVARFDREW